MEKRKTKTRLRIQAHGLVFSSPTFLQLSKIVFTNKEHSKSS